MNRTVLAILMVILGFALQAVSYFYLAAPLGIPSGPAYSDPRVPFAPLIFIIGVMLVFLAAVVYELIPDKPAKEAASVDPIFALGSGDSHLNG